MSMSEENRSSGNADTDRAEGFTPTPFPAGSLAPTLNDPRDSRTDSTESGSPCAVPGYDLLDELGRGAMGVVYRARQTAANRVVALKMILSGVRAGTEERTRFRTEAEAAARLQHPNIVQVFEVGEQTGQPFFSLEYCPGGTLEKKLNGTPLRDQEAAALVEKLARAIDHAHLNGVLHRDLKPANVLLDRDGEPKIGDFGLAKKLDEVGQTQSGAIMGTPSYMAPEQADGRGKELGPACDVYALGAILYACLTGRPPFRAATVMDTLMQVIHDEPVPPGRLQPKCPRDLETICLKCLHKESSRRYRSAAELAEDLARYQRGEPVLARPVGQLERGWRWCRRNRMTAGLLLSVALTLIAGTATSLLLFYQAREKEAEARTSAQAEKKAAEEASRLAEQERIRREKTEYLGRIRMADQLWQAGSVAAARVALDETNPAHRGWEYGHLYNALHAPQRSFLGHTDLVGFAAFSPDGLRIVSGSVDKTLRIWDARSGQEQLILRGHSGAVTTGAFSPDGQRIISGSADRTVKLWDVGRGRELRDFRGHTGPVRCVAFSPDGKHIVSAGDDTIVKGWDSASGRELLSLPGHSHTVSSVAFSPDGRLILSGSQDKTLKLWDADSGKELRTFTEPHDFINSVAFSPDGKRILTGIGYPSQSSGVSFSPEGKRIISKRTDFPLKIWDALTGQELRSLRGHTGYISRAVFSPDGTRIASASVDSKVKVWNLLGGQEPLTLSGHISLVRSVQFSPDGRRIVSAGEDRTVKVWEADSDHEAFTLTGHTGEVTSLSFSPDGKRIVSANRDKTLKLWDAGSGQELRTLIGHTDFVTCAAFSPDGKRIVSGSVDRTLRLWDAATGRELRTLKGHSGSVNAVCFSPEGKRIVSGSIDSKVKVWDADSGRELKTLAGHTGLINSVSFGPDGKRLVSGSGDRTIRVWDALDGQPLLTLTGHTAGVRSVRFSPDGKLIVSGSEDRTVKLWDANSGQELQTLKGHTNFVQSVSFSPGAQRIVSGSLDHTVKFWDTDRGQEILTLKGHTSAVEAVAFSPDGRRIISGGWDGTIKIWEDARGVERLVLRGHPYPVRSASFSPDGERLIATDTAGTTLVWEVESGQLLAGASDQPREGAEVSPDGRLLAHRDGAAVRVLLRDSPAAHARLKLLALPDPGWHAEQARESERHADWFGAGFHHERVLAVHPWDVSAHAGRAFALAQRQYPGEAAAHYLQAALWSPRALLWPSCPNAVQAAEQAALAGDWGRAASLYQLAAHQPRALIERWEGLLLSQQAARQPEVCRQSCSELLVHFGNHQDAGIRWRTGFLCRVVPLEKADAIRLVTIVERLTADNRNASNLDLLGSLLYRAGRHKDAARILEEAIRKQGEGGYVDSWLFLSLAQQKLGQMEEARQRLAMVEDWVKKQQIRTWQEKTRWQLLLEEARSQIVTMPPAPRDQ